MIFSFTRLKIFVLCLEGLIQLSDITPLLFHRKTDSMAVSVAESKEN